MIYLGIFEQTCLTMFVIFLMCAFTKTKLFSHARRCKQREAWARAALHLMLQCKCRGAGEVGTLTRKHRCSQSSSLFVEAGFAYNRHQSNVIVCQVAHDKMQCKGQLVPFNSCTSWLITGCHADRCRCYPKLQWFLCLK